MAGTFKMLPLLLVCCLHFIQTIGADDRMKVVNVPLEIDDNFLKSERQFAETDNISEDYAEDMEKKRDESSEDDTSTESTNLDSNSVTLEDVLEVNRPELTYNFLNAERKHSFDVNVKDENLAPISDDEHSRESEGIADMDNNLASSSENPHLNEIYDQVAETTLDSEIVENFLEAERFHTYSLDNSHTRLESLDFSVKSSDKDSPSNVHVCGTVNLDKIVDELIDGLREDIVKRGLDKIKIPDVYETFVKKVGFIDVKGYFQAQEGWAKNLSTIHRTADVIASSQDNKLTVTCGFGLSDLEFGYDKYKAKFMKIGPSGRLNASILENSLLLNATVSWYNGTCKTTLDYLSLNELGGFHMKITGLGPFNWLLTNISDWLFKKYHEEIREKVESTLRQEIERQLHEFDCTQYLLGWHK